MACTMTNPWLATHGTQLDETRCPLVSCIHVAPARGACGDDPPIFHAITCDQVDGREGGVPLSQSPPDAVHDDSPKAV